ncbi:Zn(2)-C6 fungal-type DNA-binding domain protein [Niveomyces insectorum RCEF 264]|uniref:Zn(2)-C6 fungal-type DNA-binding domain protein n=1 Tax=Niveomyces insectorum RCEF 264 TaxID=1081102 RepID=A0A167XSA6_9HYPO|nr:Zn(2)-C6 fungal-type DNA-binding domain protein [Niveomyces insectorum RCEF 264]
MGSDSAALRPNGPASSAVGRRLGSRKAEGNARVLKNGSRIRRIKCDEEKPACRRCTSTGRTCDGYAPAIVVLEQHHSTAQPRQDALLCVRPQRLMGDGLAVGSQHEHRALQFFTRTGASSLAGYIDVDFWTRLVPQCAHAEAAVYHAVVAVGALLVQLHDKALPHAQPSTTAGSQLATLVLEHQNKAIRSTMQALSSPQENRSTMSAVTFILLFCIEALQGREFEALRLFEHGIRALTTTTTTHTTTTTTTTSPQFTAAGLDAQLDRMRLLCGMFEGPETDTPSPAMRRALPWLAAPHPVRGPDITSRTMAHDELTDLITAVQQVVATTSGPPGDRQALEAALGDWNRRFEQYLATEAAHSPVTHQEMPHARGDAIVASMLRLRYHIARVWLADGPDRGEMLYDGYLPVFHAVVAEAAHCLRLMRADGSEGSRDGVDAGGGGDGGSDLDAPSATPLSLPFAFEMGLIPPLYWTVLKCRYPSLRRQALGLLRQAPAQEGLWNRNIMVKVAEQVIQLEEGQACGAQAAGGPIGTLASEALLPPETTRVKFVRIGLRTTLADGTRGDQVQCFTLPSGPAGGLQLAHEFFVTA